MVMLYYTLMYVTSLSLSFLVHGVVCASHESTVISGVVYFDNPRSDLPPSHEQLKETGKDA